MKTKIVNIQNLLSNYLDGYQIIEEKLSPLTSPGEHYGSIVLALDLKLLSVKNEHEEKCLNLVAKLIPCNEMLRKAFDVFVTFKKELFFYTVTVPAIVEFQKEYNIPEEYHYDNLFPKCFGARFSAKEGVTEVDDTGVLVFENLKPQGYSTEDRLKGYNTQTAKLILRGLARFHAVSIALKVIKPEVFEEKVKPCLVENKGVDQLPEIAKIFQSAILEGANDCLELENYLDKIQNICQNRNNNSPTSELWATLCHNDFWTSNCMILKDSTEMCIKSKMIDFQLQTYKSALCDLVFFMFTSIVNDDLDKHFEDFVKIYFDNFIETLKNFNIDLEPFSWTNFQKELELVGKQEVYHVLVMLKPICTERGKIKTTVESFIDSDWTRQDLLGPIHRKKLKDTVLSFVKRNWF